MSVQVQSVPHRKPPFYCPTPHEPLPSSTKDVQAHRSVESELRLPAALSPLGIDLCIGYDRSIRTNPANALELGDLHPPVQKDAATEASSEISESQGAKDVHTANASSNICAIFHVILPL